MPTNRPSAIEVLRFLADEALLTFHPDTRDELSPLPDGYDDVILDALKLAAVMAHPDVFEIWVADYGVQVWKKGGFPEGVTVPFQTVNEAFAELYLEEVTKS